MGGGPQQPAQSPRLSAWPSSTKASPPPNTTHPCSTNAGGRKHPSRAPLTTNHLLLPCPPSLHELPPCDLTVLIPHQRTEHRVHSAIHEVHGGLARANPVGVKEGSHLGGAGVRKGLHADRRLAGKERGGGTGTTVPLVRCGGVGRWMGDVGHVKFGGDGREEGGDAHILHHRGLARR